VGCYGEREPIMGVWGQSPQGNGGRAPLVLDTFLRCLGPCSGSRSGQRDQTMRKLTFHGSATILNVNEQMALVSPT